MEPLHWYRLNFGLGLMVIGPTLSTKLFDAARRRPGAHITYANAKCANAAHIDDGGLHMVTYVLAYMHISKSLLSTRVVTT